MIGLRQAFVQAQKNPFLRVIVFLLLAVLAVFVAIHASHDQIFQAGVVCLALVLLVVALFRVPEPVALVTARTPRLRGPPRLPLLRRPRPLATVSLSLRL